MEKEREFFAARLRLLSRPQTNVAPPIREIICETAEVRPMWCQVHEYIGLNSKLSN